jgi:hypothetical protein
MVHRLMGYGLGLERFLAWFVADLLCGSAPCILVSQVDVHLESRSEAHHLYVKI